jgi:type I restriction enzyme, S subunit
MSKPSRTANSEAPHSREGGNSVASHSLSSTSGWRESVLGEEIALQYGKSLRTDKREAGTIKVYGSNGVVGHHSRAAVKGPGIIVGRKGSVGEIAYSPKDFWPIDTTYYVENKRDNNWLFLYYLLATLGLNSLNSHSAVPGLNRESAYPIRCSIPPKPEQEIIAAVLWKLQRAIATQDRLLQATRDLRQSAMHRLFTRGLRGEPLKDTEIGPMPESWRPRPLPELCEIWSGGTPRKSTPEFWKGDIPWVSGKDLKSVELDDAIDHVSAEGVKAGSKLAPSGSVLLLVRGMGLAKDLPVSVITRPMAFNQDIKALVPRDEYSGRFIRSAIYVAKERLRSQIVPSAHGTMTLNLNDLETFLLACPSTVDEAEAIAAALATIDRKIAHHRAKRAALDALFQTLLHKLMTAQIPVAALDIDTSEITGPTSEPESALTDTAPDLNPSSPAS